MTNSPGSPASARVAPNVLAACLANFSAYVPITAVVVALPTIQRGLHASTSDLTWVVDAFVIPMAAFIMAAGTLGDLLGRRRVLLSGLVLVIIGCGLGLASKSSIDLLLAAQAISGTGAAVLLPSSLSVISNAIPDPARRAPAIGAWAAALALALAAGPWLSTLVLDTIGAHWQWLYAALLPWPVLGLAIAAWGIDESKVSERRGFDASGQLAGVVLVVAAVYGVIQGPGHGWSSALVIASFAVALVALVALVLIERRVRTPMLPAGLFGSPAFSVTGVATAVLMFGLIGSMFLLSLFFGSVQHLGVSHLALRFLPLFVAIAVLGPVAGRVSQRLGARATCTVGLVVCAGGLFSLTGVHPDTAFSGVWWRMTVIGVGFGVAFAPLTATAVASVPHPLAGLAGSANNAFRQTGGALGPAVLGAVLTSRILGRLPATLASHHVPSAAAARVTGLVRVHGTGALASLTPSPRTLPILHAAADASASALHTTVTIGAIALLASAALTLALLRTRRPATDQPGDAAQGTLRERDGAGEQVAASDRALAQDSSRQREIFAAQQADREAEEWAPTAERLAAATHELALAQHQRAAAEYAHATAQRRAAERLAETTHELALAQRERAAAENASATAQQRAAELEHALADRLDTVPIPVGPGQAT